jgi:hypothetical protein
MQIHIISKADAIAAQLAKPIVPLTHKEITAHLRKRIAVAGIKARVRLYEACGDRYIQVSGATFEAEFSEEEQRTIRQIAKTNGLTFAQGMEIDRRADDELQEFRFCVPRQQVRGAKPMLNQTMTNQTRWYEYTVSITLKVNKGSFGIKYEHQGEFRFCAQSPADARSIAGHSAKGATRSIDVTKIVEIVGCVPVSKEEIPERTYCGDSVRGCGASLTEADLEAGFCTQCHEPLVASEFPLEHALLMSLEQVESAKRAA